MASPDVDHGDRGAPKSATLVRFHWANWLHRPSVSTCRLRCWPAPLCRHDACACGHFSEPAADAGKCCCIAAAATPKIAGTPLLVLGYHLNEDVEKHQVGEVITDLNQNKLEEYLKTYNEQGYQDIIVALARLKQEVRDIFRTIHIGEE